MNPKRLLALGGNYYYKSMDEDVVYPEMEND